MPMIKACPRIFNQDDYNDCDLLAFQEIKKDFSHFFLHKPEVEDYGIDVLAWESEEAMNEGLPALFGLELEVKKTPDWKDNKYPYHSVHFLSRKTRLLNLPCIPFWVLYNSDFKESLILPVSYAFRGRLQILNRFSKTTVECVYDIPMKYCLFGRENMEDFVLQYYASIADVEQSELLLHLRSYMGMVNGFNRKLCGLEKVS